MEGLRSKILTVVVFTCTLSATMGQDENVIPLTAEQINESLGSSSNKFLPGFVSSLSVTILSELGDKTFFIAAILAMKQSRSTVFLGCITALIIMTILSVALGSAANLIPQIITHYLSVFLFAVFGLKMIYDAYKMKASDAVDEYNDTEKELLLKEEEKKKKSGCSQIPLFSEIFWQSLTMTFLAEWGDRSQISTVLLAARNNIYGVTTGTILGHSLCTFLAVIAGRLVAHKISVKTVTYIGGVVFIACAIFELVTGLYEGTSDQTDLVQT